jgi:pyruvate dehydrogenase complex dehydrogenase (E1) component
VNRQCLDAVIREGLWERFEAMFEVIGWDVVILKHGALQQQAFAEPNGEHVHDRIDRCPNQLYSALTYQGEPHGHAYGALLRRWGRAMDLKQLRYLQAVSDRAASSRQL